jgi:hypothetical protein
LRDPKKGSYSLRLTKAGKKPVGLQAMAYTNYQKYASISQLSNSFPFTFLTLRERALFLFNGR